MGDCFALACEPLRSPGAVARSDCGQYGSNPISSYFRVDGTRQKCKFWIASLVLKGRLEAGQDRLAVAADLLGSNLVRSGGSPFRLSIRRTLQPVF